MTVLSILSSGCTLLPCNRSNTLLVELRNNTDKDLPSKLKAEFVSESFIVSSAPKSVNSKSVTYSYFKGYENRRYIVTDSGEGYAQIFEIKLPTFSIQKDWTDWADPIYIDRSPYPSFDLLHDQRKENRITNIPAEHLQIRYKIAVKE